MKDRPILFSAPMVRAILDGSKTQTRRIVKPQPLTPWLVNDASCCLVEKCPYGKPGDRLWVRERISWKHAGGNWLGVTYTADGKYQEFLEPPAEWNIDDPERVRPSIHMPRWASRITLEIVNVRVERLQEISQTDAICEGAHRAVIDSEHLKDEAARFERRVFNEGQPYVTPKAEFAALWESINGKGSWTENPWVWVIEFRRLP